MSQILRYETDSSVPNVLMTDKAEYDGPLGIVGITDLETGI